MANHMCGCVNTLHRALARSHRWISRCHVCARGSRGRTSAPVTEVPDLLESQPIRSLGGDLADRVGRCEVDKFTIRGQATERELRADYELGFAALLVDLRDRAPICNVDEAGDLPKHDHPQLEHHDEAAADAGRDREMSGPSSVAFSACERCEQL